MTRSERVQAAAFWSVPALFSLAFSTRLFDRDLWWHLATGRLIFEQGHVPTRDPFSYTAADAPWTYVTTGADLLLYLVEHFSGPTGLGVLKVVVAFVMLASLAVACRLAGAGRSASGAAVVVATVLVQFRYALLRPATLGAALMALGCAVLLAWWKDPRRRWLAAFASIAALWTTVHATAVLAPVLLLGAVVEAASLSDRRGSIRDLAVAWLATAALFALLPSGRGAVLSTYAHLSNPDLTIFIAEWAPGDMASPRFWLPIVMGVTGLALRPRLLRTAPLPVFFWSLGIVLTLRGVRNQYEAILLAVPLIALGIDAVSDRFAAAGLRIAAAAAVLVWPLGTFAAVLFLERGPLFATWWGFGVRTETTPEDCVRVLFELPRGRVLNDLDTGGYLIWRNVPVFADGRTLLVYDREHFERWFIPAFGSPEGMLAAADAFGATYGLALPYKSLGQMMMASPDFVPVFHGVECSLFVRRASAPAVVRAGRPLLEEVRGVAEPSWMRRFYESVLSTPGGRRALETALGRVRRESPSTPVLPIVEATVATILADRGGRTKASERP